MNCTGCSHGMLIIINNMVFDTFPADRNGRRPEVAYTLLFADEGARGCERVQVIYTVAAVLPDLCTIIVR